MPSVMEPPMMAGSPYSPSSQTIVQESSPPIVAGTFPDVDCGACEDTCTPAKGHSHAGGCARRLWEWLTYRPLRAGCPACGDSCCCCKCCNPCCHPHGYEYFLRDCSGGHGCASCAEPTGH
jgi:hypothetical protein